MSTINNTMADSTLAQKQKLIESAISSISSELYTFISSFERLRKGSSSSLAKDDIFLFKEQIQSVKEKLSNLPNKNLEKQSDKKNHLVLIMEETKKLSESMNNLVQLSENVKESLSQVNKDASSNMQIEIIETKIKDEVWCIKVRSNEKCTENFRNVDIIEIESERNVCSFLLIEPKVIMKKTLEDHQLLCLNHLVAKIGNKVVSNPVIIPQIKITNFYIADDVYKIDFESMASNELTNLRIINRNYEEILPIESIPAYSKMVGVELSAEFASKETLYVECNGVIISNAYSLDFTVHDEPEEPPAEENYPDAYNEDPNLQQYPVDGDENPVEILRQKINSWDDENHKILAVYLKENYPFIDDQYIIEGVEYCGDQGWDAVYSHFVDLGWIQQ